MPTAALPIVETATPMNENRRSYSPKQLADELGVSVQTVQRWADAGLVKAWKTLGGHRKIDAASADSLIQAMRTAGDDASARGRAVRPGASPRVLIVDDDPAALQVVELLIEETFPGAQIETARNGFLALQALGRATPDILVTDIVMPHIDGFEMLRHLATQDSRPALVVVTSVLEHDDVERKGGLPPGVVFLHKPLDQDAFVALLRSKPMRPTPAAD